MKLTKFSLKFPFLAAGLSLLTLLSACAPKNDHGTLTPPPPEAPASESYSATYSTPSSAVAPEKTNSTRARLSRFFLVEQSNAAFSSSLAEAFRRDPPGGLVFWNFSKSGWQALAQTTARYSQILKQNGHAPALFSVDYEGGGLTMSPSGKQIPGIQRFRAGFTDLAHGVWLGKAIRKHGFELCELHGRIMGKELAAVGVNYPLTLVSDLAQRLFTVRGISSDAQDVARCMETFTEAMAQAGPVIAVTKHYPGLGQNSGDTHDVVSVSTAKTMADSDRHLAPFHDLVNFANRKGLESRLSIMSSHGKFPLLDSQNLTTESSTLLEGLLRDRFDFRGIRVSDAMWMGGYGDLQGDALYAVYLNAFTSGLDLLMIPGGRFGGALKAFQHVHSDSASPALRSAIENRSRMSFSEFRAKFLRRVDESLNRIDQTLRTLPYSHEIITGDAPSTLTVRERARYYEILRDIDARWDSQLPLERRSGL